MLVVKILIFIQQWSGVVGERLGLGSHAENPGIVPASPQSGRSSSNGSGFSLSKSTTSASSGMRR